MSLQGVPFEGSLSAAWFSGAMVQGCPSDCSFGLPLSDSVSESLLFTDIFAAISCSGQTCGEGPFQDSSNLMTFC